MSRRPTFTVTEPLVMIHMRGVPHPKGGLYRPDDHEVYGELLQEMIAKRLPSDVKLLTGGGGQFVMLWRATDAPKIISWLNERADRVKEHPKHGG